MKFICTKDALNYAINIAQKAVATKATLEILEYILVIADETGLKLRSNNLQLAIETPIPNATVERKGYICLEARMFGEIVKNLPSGDVEVDVLETFEAVIKASKSKFKLKGLDGKDFPIMRSIENGVSFDINVETYNDMIKKNKLLCCERWC